MEKAQALALAAEALVGTPFRLQGRDPLHGLDCIGLVFASLKDVGVRIELPADYRPRRRSFTIPQAALLGAGLTEAVGERRPGDILLLQSAPAQVHAGVAIDQSDVVHAHARLGRVVRSALPDGWPVLAAWRIVPDGDPSWQR